MNHSHRDEHPEEQHAQGRYAHEPHPGGDHHPNPAAGGGAAATEAPKKRRRWPWIVGIVGALVAGVGIGSAGEVEPEVVTETETVTEEVEVEVEVEPADLEERREVIAEDEESLEARASELDDREDALDAREEELASQAEQDAETQEAEEEAASASESGSIPGSGTFLVGEEIQAGTYRTEDTSGFCYWARLSGLSGEFDDIITNGIPEGQGFVTIADTDVAFETSDCGEWVAQ